MAAPVTASYLPTVVEVVAEAGNQQHRLGLGGARRESRRQKRDEAQQRGWHNGNATRSTQSRQWPTERRIGSYFVT